MKPSHPPSLITRVLTTAREENLFTPGDAVLVAVSGGPDSMALLSSLAHVAERLHIRLLAHGIDHGLRPEAQAELDLAASVARSLEVPFDVTRIEIPHGGNLMARARALRYEALRAAVVARAPAGATRQLIATGHHADDRAETVLLRMLRGSGPGGLGVLPARAGDLVRPMIRARRRDILDHLTRHRVPFAEDPSNRDPRFLRVRVRRELLPLLTDLSPRIVEHLCSLAEATLAPASAPPELEGERLGRAQRLLLARAQATQSSRARVPLEGGKVARLDLSTGKFVLMKGK